MANHKSSLKRIRQEETRRLHNRYYGKTMRNAVRKLRATTRRDKKTSQQILWQDHEKCCSQASRYHRQS
ncbi:30S ribosomal protein S20 [Bacteroides eggerthii CAG:109]|nr:30S ribosomal protein S20 [Bacteroides eggerthii CAG:109]